MPEVKVTGIFIKVTEEFSEHLVKSFERPAFQELKSKGYKIDKSVIGRFGYLLVMQDPELLAKYPELLLAAASANSATTKIAQEQSIG